MLSRALINSNNNDAITKGYGQIIVHMLSQLNRHGHIARQSMKLFQKKYFINNMWKWRKCPILTSNSQHLIHDPWLFPCGANQIHISIRSIKIISSEIQNTAISLNNKNTRTDSGYTSHCQWTGDTPMKSKNLNSKVHLTPTANLGEIQLVDGRFFTGYKLSLRSLKFYVSII